MLGRKPICEPAAANIPGNWGKGSQSSGGSGQPTIHCNLPFVILAWTYSLKWVHHPSVQFSSVQLLNCLWPFATPGLQHTRAPCSSPIPRVYPNSCPLSGWCHPDQLILWCPCLPLPSILPSIRVFSNESVFLHQVAKVLEFQVQHQSFQRIFMTDFL